MNTKTQASAWQKLTALAFAIAAAFSLAGALNAAPALMQVAWADEVTTLVITSNNLTDVAADDSDAYAYYVKSESPCSVVDFSEVIGTMEDGMIAAINSNYYAPDAREARATAANFAVSADDMDAIAEYLDEEKIADYDFSADTYVFWIMDDDYSMYYFILQMPAADPADEDLDQTFSVSVDGMTMTGITRVEDGWTYNDYYTGATKVPLYTIQIPAGTTKATITTQMPRLFYNYNAVDEYTAGWVDDATVGATSATVDIDASGIEYGTDNVIPADGNPDFIQVQRPYKDDWSDGKLLYAITFEYVDPKPISTAALAATKYIYNGKAKTPSVTVKDADGKTLVKNADYTVAYKNNVNAGTATITVTGKAFYKGTISKTFSIAKASQAITAEKTTVKKTYKTKSGKLASPKTIKSAKKAFGLSAKTAMTYKKTSGTTKITVSSSGKITVKKGLKKGTYKVSIKVKAATGTNYKSATKTVTLKVVVK